MKYRKTALIEAEQYQPGMEDGIDENGKNHERLNFLLILPATFFLAFFLGWQHLDIIQSSVFITLWIIGTLFITCDLDIMRLSRNK